MSFPVRVAFAMLTLSPLAVAADRDIHSFANPEHVRVRHVDLDLDVDFDKASDPRDGRPHRRADLEGRKQPLVLDTRGLTIETVETLDRRQGLRARRRSSSARTTRSSGTR